MPTSIEKPPVNLRPRRSDKYITPESVGAPAQDHEKNLASLAPDVRKQIISYLPKKKSPPVQYELPLENQAPASEG